MIESTEHPDIQCQSIEEFCHHHKVTTGDTLYKAIRDLTLKVAGSRRAIWFPTVNVNHLGSPAIKDKSITKDIDYDHRLQRAERDVSHLKAKRKQLKSQYVRLADEKHKLDAKVIEIKKKLNQTMARNHQLEAIFMSLKNTILGETDMISDSRDEAFILQDSSDDHLTTRDTS